MGKHHKTKSHQFTSVCRQTGTVMMQKHVFHFTFILLYVRCQSTARKLAYYGHTIRKQRRKRQCKEQCHVHAGEEGHARPGWTTSRRGQDAPWKSQSEWQRTGIDRESTSMVWPTLGSRTAKEQNRTLDLLTAAVPLAAPARPIW